MKKLGIFLTLMISLTSISFTYAQYTTDKVVGKKKTELKDSLMHSDYPYMLPIWGKKVVAKGYNLPYSAGLSVQYLWQQSDIIINNLQVGFNNGPKYNLDQIVRFDKATSTSNGVNIRPDFWLFPFLNVYAVFAKSKLSTAINAGVYIPDSSGAWNKILPINTKANFDATTYGFGLTPTFGIGGAFMALDMNFTWTDIPELEKPAYAFVFGPRVGKNFTLKNQKSNIAIWVGGFRVKLNSGTSGSLNATDLFPIDKWQSTIDTGYIKVNNAQQNVDAWWNGLTDAQKANPVNQAKYSTANNALERAGGILDQASQVVSGAGNASVQYSLDKRPKNMWNFIVGTQYQINKSWMIRAEYGFLGSRQQFIGGLQYRFGL